jgi:hypothetical protein
MAVSQGLCHSYSVDWTAVGATATAIYTIAFTISMWLIGRQLKEARTSRDTGLLLALYDRLTASRAKAQLVEQNEMLLGALTSLNDWDQLCRDHPDLGAAVDDVSLDYNLAGLFLRSGLLDKEAFLQDIGEVYLHLYTIIAPAIELQRQRNGSRYRRDLDTLAEHVRAALRLEQAPGTPKAA